MTNQKPSDFAGRALRRIDESVEPSESGAIDTDVLAEIIREEQDAEGVAEEIRGEVIGEHEFDIGDAMQRRIADLIRQGRSDRD